MMPFVVSMLFSWRFFSPVLCRVHFHAERTAQPIERMRKIFRYRYINICIMPNDLLLLYVRVSVARKNHVLCLFRILSPFFFFSHSKKFETFLYFASHSLKSTNHSTVHPIINCLPALCLSFLSHFYTRFTKYYLISVALPYAHSFASYFLVSCVVPRW